MTACAAGEMSKRSSAKPADTSRNLDAQRSRPGRGVQNDSLGCAAARLAPSQKLSRARQLRVDRGPFSLELGSPLLSQPLEVIKAHVNRLWCLSRQGENLQVGDCDGHAIRAVTEHVAKDLAFAPPARDISRSLATKLVYQLADFGMPSTSGRSRKSATAGYMAPRKTPNASRMRALSECCRSRRLMVNVPLTPIDAPAKVPATAMATPSSALTTESLRQVPTSPTDSPARCLRSRRIRSCARRPWVCRVQIPTRPLIASLAAITNPL